MRCEKCQNEATVHITKVVNNQKEEVHLCEECAEQHDPKIEHILGALDLENVTNVNITTEENVVSQMLEQAEAALTEALQGIMKQVKTCPDCGFTLQRFMKTGKFGCPKDYELFKEELQPVIERIQGGNTQHLGKIPQNAVSVQQQVELLEKEMTTAIKSENYERAAQIRDTLKELQKS